MLKLCKNIRENIAIIVIMDHFSNFKLFSYIFSVLVWHGKALFEKKKNSTGRMCAGNITAIIDPAASQCMLQRYE